MPSSEHSGQGPGSGSAAASLASRSSSAKRAAVAAAARCVSSTLRMTTGAARRPDILKAGDKPCAHAMTARMRMRANAVAAMCASKGEPVPGKFSTDNQHDACARAREFTDIHVLTFDPPRPYTRQSHAPRLLDGRTKCPREAARAATIESPRRSLFLDRDFVDAKPAATEVLPIWNLEVGDCAQ